MSSISPRRTSAWVRPAHLPVASTSVDWVISNCVVNLSPEKPRVLADVAHVLRPGGRMLISDSVVDRSAPRWLRSLAARFSPAAAKAIDEPG